MLLARLLDRGVVSEGGEVEDGGGTGGVNSDSDGESVKPGTTTGPGYAVALFRRFLAWSSVTIMAESCMWEDQV